MIQYFTASDGAKLAYRDTGGDGLPLLCLPGLTRTVADFDYLAPHLSGTRMIALDYRGRGLSDWTGADTYTVPQEAKDVIELLDHLALPRAAVLGTSRGGLISMVLAAMARDRLAGVCLNDIGPEVAAAGLDRIKDYVGTNPNAPDYATLAAAMKANTPGFDGLPDSRWLEEAQKHYVRRSTGLTITYDPALKESFLKAFAAEPPDLWPLFDALAGSPLALIRGANSDLLTPECTAEMQRRRPDMGFANVPDRAHIPFLDEPGSLAVIRDFLKAVA